MEVLRMISATTSLLMVGVRPGRGASFFKPESPLLRKRFLQRATFLGVMPSVAAMVRSCLPSDAMSAIRARSAIRTCVFRPLGHSNNVDFSSAASSILGATRIKMGLLDRYRRGRFYRGYYL